MGEEEQKTKERKLNKYWEGNYAVVVGDISISLANKYCVGCDIPFSPGFFHTCLLSDCDKINEYAREALNIGLKNGTIYKTFRDKVEEKNFKKSLFTSEEIEKCVKYDRENPRKFKDVKRLAINLFE